MRLFLFIILLTCVCNTVYCDTTIDLYNKAKEDDLRNIKWNIKRINAKINCSDLKKENNMEELTIKLNEINLNYYKIKERLNYLFDSEKNYYLVKGRVDNKYFKFVLQYKNIKLDNFNYCSEVIYKINSESEVFIIGVIIKDKCNKIVYEVETKEIMLENSI